MIGWSVGLANRSRRLPRDKLISETAPTLQSTSDNNDYGRVFKCHSFINRFPDTFVDVVIIVEESLLSGLFSCFFSVPSIVLLIPKRSNFFSDKGVPTIPFLLPTNKILFLKLFISTVHFVGRVLFSPRELLCRHRRKIHEIERTKRT